MAELPDGLISFGPDANCTLDLCPLEASILEYQPSIPANGTFIAVFALAMIVHAIQGFRTRTWGFLASMLSGCILEIVGYVGRLILHGNPFDFVGFLIQIGLFTSNGGFRAKELLTIPQVCITLAPVFFCSAIYVLLSQV